MTTALPPKLLSPFAAASSEAIAALIVALCPTAASPGMESTVRNLLAAEAGAFPAWEIHVSGTGPDLEAFLDSFGEPHVVIEQAEDALLVACGKEHAPAAGQTLRERLRSTYPRLDVSVRRYQQALASRI